MGLQQEGPKDLHQEKRHNESLMPLTLGAPPRVPYYAYPAWGLVYKGEEQADVAYREEWGAGNAGQLDLVSKAMIEAGYGNFPELLRQETAKTVSELLKDRSDSQPLNILDIGAGPGLSALTVYEALPPKLKPVTTMILVDPSAESLKAARQKMEEKGIKFKIISASDTEALKEIEGGSIDILTGVASVHHHAKIPFDLYRNVLRKGGSAVFADWHQTLWEHPGSVLRLFEQFDWPQKEKGIKNWLATYPKAGDIPPLPDDPADRKAIEQIIGFWKSYRAMSQRSNLGPNAIWPLEGHRPVQRYAQEMTEAGFRVSKPQQILPDSSLLQVTVGQKI
ncbi:MAG: class I SAM-dependent methyltransferase [Candidatus Levybacteria bacterium]|nr:class I SAM-dependent methyltransferase [Candidatus Levybacteria bacterium]